MGVSLRFDPPLYPRRPPADPSIMWSPLFLLYHVSPRPPPVRDRLRYLAIPLSRPLRELLFSCPVVLQCPDFMLYYAPFIELEGRGPTEFCFLRMYGVPRFLFSHS